MHRGWRDFLDVSRKTVLEAYDELMSQGWLYGQRGSGTRVSGVARRIEHAIREANYPARVVTLADQDGNALYIHF